MIDGVILPLVANSCSSGAAGYGGFEDICLSNGARDAHGLLGFEPVDGGLDCSERGPGRGREGFLNLTHG
jgi:hypothetical protein